MKQFEFPDMNIIRFSLSDIITTSNEFPLDEEEQNVDELPAVYMN